MRFDERRRLLWPLLLAVAFIFIPIIPFLAYPIGFWCSNDYQPLGLANALNMAYRLADLRFYAAEGMTNHPGVPFYFMSWLALAFTGYPVATPGQGFFRAVVDHVEDYYRISVYIAALVGAAAVYLFARTALRLLPIGVVVVALLIWLVSTPATILAFVTTGNEPVALLINAFFLVVLVRIASDSDIDPKVMVLAGFVGAFAYLNKLAYVYVPLALVSAIFWKAVFCGVGWRRGARLIALSFFIFIGVIVAAGYFVLGWNAFIYLLKFHRNVILGSGRYGTGSQVVISATAVWHAITATADDKTYALPLALIAGAALFTAGLVVGFKNRRENSVAIIAIGAGLAALLSALSVMKHYDSHYTAGVSAALPGCVLACYLLAKDWSWRLHFSAIAAACIAVLLMTGPVLLDIRDTMAFGSATSRLVLEDMKEVDARTAATKGLIDFTYRVPFPQYLEGFVVHFAGIPRLSEEYVKNKGNIKNDLAAPSDTDDVGAYVLDKSYFPDAAAVRNAPKLDPLGFDAARFNAGDELIELHRVFLVIRK